MNGACCQSMARAIRKARATSSMPPPGSSTTCASSVMVVARCRSLVSKTRFSLAQANRTGGGSSFYRRSRVNGTESSLTLCWREMDSNFRFRARGAIAIRPFALHLCPEGPERRRRPQSQGQARPARYAGQSGPRAGRLEPGTRATKHRHQHGHCDRLAGDALVLHPGRNERVE